MTTMFKKNSAKRQDGLAMLSVPGKPVLFGRSPLFILAFSLPHLFRFSCGLALAAVLGLIPVEPALAQKTDDMLTVRVKDVAEIEGVRDNQLIGYGIVIGLNRTGDQVQQNLYARQPLQNLLERMAIAT